MKPFAENDCRICSQTFCCQDCRIKHEERKHKVNHNCDICIFGFVKSRELLSSKVLVHIRAVHWPLSCILCKHLFTAIDDLMQHDTCYKTESFKFHCTPITPIIQNPLPFCDGTPLYKLPPQVDLGIIRKVTSTPLVPQDDSNKLMKTPQDCSNIKYVFKSSIKLIGSATLNDSKRSERRVTFSEMPIIVKNSNKRIDAGSDDSDEDAAFVTVDKDISTDLIDDKENLGGVPNHSSNLTFWNTALSHEIETSVDIEEQIFIASNLSQQLENIEDSTGDVVCLKQGTSSGIWSSVTSIVKSVMQNISVSLPTCQNSSLNSSINVAVSASESLKRSFDDIDSELPILKRMKFADIKCRRPIRHLTPLQVRMIKPKLVNKAVQTDPIDLTN